MEVLDKGQMKKVEIPLRNAMNEQLRDEYVKDCMKGLAKWNKALEREGVSERLTLPSTRFNRGIGVFADGDFNLEGKLISRDEFEAMESTWLPTPEDEAYVKSLMKPVVEPGKMANWIAAPRKGINGQPVDYDYVRTDI